jgi:hypothetical protein
MYASCVCPTMSKVVYILLLREVSGCGSAIYLIGYKNKSQSKIYVKCGTLSRFHHFA